MQMTPPVSSKSCARLDHMRRIGNMLQHIIEMDGVEPANARRIVLIEEPFGDQRAQGAGMRRRLARRLDTVRAASRASLRSEGKIPDRSRYRAGDARSGGNRLSNTVQPVGLRQLRPSLIFAGMDEEGGLFASCNIRRDRCARVQRASGKGSACLKPQVSHSIMSLAFTRCDPEPRCAPSRMRSLRQRGSCWTQGCEPIARYQPRRVR